MQVDARQYIENINSRGNLVYFNRLWLDVMGDLAGAVFVDQLVFWCRQEIRKSDPEGWVYKTQSDWSEFALSRRDVERSRTKLIDLDVIEAKLMGVPARMHYRIKYLNLAKLIEKISNPDCQKEHSDCKKMQTSVLKNTNYSETYSESYQILNTNPKTPYNPPMGDDVNIPDGNLSKRKRKSAKRQSSEPVYSDNFLRFWASCGAGCPRRR